MLVASAVKNQRVHRTDFPLLSGSTSRIVRPFVQIIAEFAFFLTVIDSEADVYVSILLQGSWRMFRFERGGLSRSAVLLHRLLVEA
jgi:hypothetical protein